MKKLLILSLILFGAASVSACSTDMPELKSPCVGAEDSPCDRRAPAKQAAV